MQINKLRIQNFMSHKDSTLNLAERGLILLEGYNRDRGGSNGSGKSSILNGLHWVLYGETLNGVPASGINRKGPHIAQVEVWFTLDDKDVYILRRNSSDSKKGELKLEINGGDATAGTISATQKKINQLLRMDAYTFKTIVYWTSNAQGFASLTDKGQKEVLTGILKAHRFEEAYERAHNKHGEVQAALLASSGYLEHLDRQLETRQETVKHLESADRGYKVKRATEIKQAEALIEALNQSKPKVDPILRVKIEALEEDIAIKRETAGPAKRDLSVLVQKVSQLDQQILQAKFGVKRASEDSVEVKIPTVEELMEGRTECPTCEQRLTEKALRSLRKSAEMEITKAKFLKKQADAKVDELLAKIELLTKEREGLQKTKEALEAQIAGLPELELDLTRTKMTLESQVNALENWEALRAASAEALEKAKSEPNPYGPLLAAERVSIGKLEQDKREALALREKQEEQLRYLRFWKEGFGRAGVLSYLLDTIVPYLNERVNAYLRILTGGEATVYFSAQGVNADGQLIDRFGASANYAYGAESYRGTSDGERRRIDLACLFALGDLAQSFSMASCRLRMLDEPFGPLDDVGHEQIVRLFREQIAPKVGTILVTAHENAVKQLFEQRIVVAKERGISSIEEE